MGSITMITSVTFSEFKTIIFPSILGKGSTVAGTETSNWSSASPRPRGDGVERDKLSGVGDGEQRRFGGLAQSVDDWF